LFYLIIYIKAHTTTGTTSAPWAAVLASMSTGRAPPAARAPLQDVSRAPPPATDDGQQRGTLGGVLGDDLSQPDTLGTSSRASGTHPGGPAAYLQQFRGKGEGVPIQ